ncbi:MAG: Lysoplasmalogenase [Candidatus Aminicenantes bacterium]|nr:Lysoplasmalogenase [Candidatus Aminicenantes bacterium]
MRLDTWLAVILISLSAAFAISGKYQRSKLLHYAFKPLTMLMIISLAWERTVGNPSAYGYLILAGLCLSFFGDVFLMLPSRYFRPGLMAFLTAQVFYIAAFSRDLGRLSFSWLWIILAYAAMVFLVLYRGLGKYRWPVLVYVLALSAMSWLALNRHFNLGGQSSLWAAIGAFLFLASDSVNAVNRFRKPFKAAQVIILSAYFAAQLLFALSVPALP